MNLPNIYYLYAKLVISNNKQPFLGFHGIEPKKIGFVVAGGEFYSYYNLQYIKLDKENKI